DRNSPSRASVVIAVSWRNLSNVAIGPFQMTVAASRLCLSAQIRAARYIPTGNIRASDYSVFAAGYVMAADSRLGRRRLAPTSTVIPGTAATAQPGTNK